MKTLKKGEVTNLKVAIINGDKMLVTADYKEEHEVRPFTVLRVPQKTNLHYMILVDEDIAGWNISEFHVLYMGVEAKYLNKKFFDIDEDYII